MKTNERFTLKEIAGLIRSYEEIDDITENEEEGEKEEDRYDHGVNEDFSRFVDEENDHVLGDRSIGTEGNNLVGKINRKAIIPKRKLEYTEEELQ